MFASTSEFSHRGYPTIGRLTRATVLVATSAAQPS
jgi:hypothetical protein